MRTPGDEASSGAGRASDAASRLGQDLAEVARREVRALRDDLMAGLRRFGVGGALFAGAGVCGLLALCSAHETALRGLEAVMPRGRAAAVLTCVYGCGAAVLTRAACNRVNAAAEAAADALEKGAEDLDSAAPAPGPQAPESSA
ncbi:MULTISPECIES: phage holin family protein [unclassified Streptomyces]|uniref:phage holin family protein n=1 Tax=unclassified Streptomyces TaxID=2593676 RepID=UPI002741CE05|nr:MULTISPECIES: phage holin family protein [unclassified Streptomyces]